MSSEDELSPELAAGEAQHPAVCCHSLTSSCVLTTQVFYEIQSSHVIKGLRSSGLIPREVDDNPDKTPRRSQFKSESPLLVFERYVKNMDKDGFIPLRFYPSSRAVRFNRFYGRVYGNGMATLTRKIKQTLSVPCPALGWEGYYDIDIKNCHPTIVRETLRQDPALDPNSYRHLSEFVDHRPRYLNEVERAFGVSTDDAKSLFLSLFFGGSSAGWFRSKRDGMTVANPSMLRMPEMVTYLERELHEVIQYLIRFNKSFYASCEKHEQNNAKRDPQYHKNPRGRFLSLWSQTRELQIISAIVEALLETTATLVKGKRVLVYEYDAIKLYRGAVNTFLRERNWTLPQFLAYLSDIVVGTFNINITFCCKEGDEAYDISSHLASQPEEHDLVVVENLRQFIREMERPDRCERGTLAFGTHLAVASFIINIQYPGVFIYFKDEWYCWDDEEGGWECYHIYGRPVDKLDKAISSVSTYLQNRAEELLMSLNITMDDLYNSAEWSDDDWALHGITSDKIKIIQKFKSVLESTKRNIGNESFHRGVVAFARTEASVRNLRFNRDPYLLGFPNGCFDFHSNPPVFRSYVKEDYVTMRCGISFDESNTEIHDKLNVLLDRIFPNPEVREYAFAVLGTALLGVPVENLFVFNGAGRNGKGLVDEVMATLLGTNVRDGYCTPSFNPATLCAAIEANKPYPELVDLEYKRFVTSKEPPNGKKLNNGTVRALTGGQGITARRLHANTEPVTIHATWVLECNEKPPFQETPMMADMKRISNVPFQSIFTEKPSEVNEPENWYLCDPELKSDAWKPLLALELFHILVPYASAFIQNGCKMPSAPQLIVNLTMEYVLDSFLVKKAFEEIYYECGGDDEIAAEDILARIKEADFFQDYTQAEKRVFKRDTFGKNLAEVFKHTYGQNRFRTHRHAQTGKLTYSFIGFAFVGA